MYFKGVTFAETGQYKWVEKNFDRVSWNSEIMP